MESAEIIDISKEAIIVLLKISMPVMLTALIVGLIISLLQALTQIQETTLTFVPKIVAILIVLIISMPFIVDTLKSFSDELAKKIVEQRDKH